MPGEFLSVPVPLSQNSGTRNSLQYCPMAQSTKINTHIGVIFGCLLVGYVLESARLKSAVEKECSRYSGTKRHLESETGDNGAFELSERSTDGQKLNNNGPTTTVILA